MVFDLTRERLALLADEHTAVVDVPGIEPGAFVVWAVEPTPPVYRDYFHALIPFIRACLDPSCARPYA